MLQKCAILGLALLLVGGLATAWVYNETRTEEAQTPSLGVKHSLGPEEYIEKYGRWYQLSSEQQNQLVLELEKHRQDKTQEQLNTEQKASLRADLEMLAAGQMDPGPLANDLYGAGWENEVEQYKKLKEQMEIVQIISIVCVSIGGMLFAVCTLLWILRTFVRIVCKVRERPSRWEEDPQPKAELTDIEPVEPQQEDPPIPEERPKQGRRRLAMAEPAALSHGDDNSPPHPVAGEEFLSPLVAARARMGRTSVVAQAGDEEAGVAVLLADEPSQETEWSPDAQWSLQGGTEASTVVVIPREPQLAPRTKPPAAQAHPVATAAENKLKEQAEGLQKQIAEFKQVAQSVQQATREQSEPLSNTLKELTQQVSAIREYAACQQDRVEKLQDGYDWGIIRTFGLRVIRCIDNIESRIENPPKDCDDLIYLEEVRDELLFAMESSGIEQFKPEINSEYHGQEKLAEAIRDKEPAQKPEQAGRIAQVLRPGYRYMIDDENYKVVRTAQVRLFG